MRAQRKDQPQSKDLVFVFGASRQFHFGKWMDFGGTPPPGISGIMNLAGNREVIYGAQQLAGKILSRKELDHSVHEVLRVAQDLGGGLVRPPNASTFALVSLGSLDCEPQGLGSHRRVIAQRVSENGDTSHLSLVVPSSSVPSFSRSIALQRSCNSSPPVHLDSPAVHCADF